MTDLLYIPKFLRRTADPDAAPLMPAPAARRLALVSTAPKRRPWRVRLGDKMYGQVRAITRADAKRIAIQRYRIRDREQQHGLTVTDVSGRL